MSFKVFLSNFRFRLLIWMQFLTEKNRKRISIDFSVFSINMSKFSVWPERKTCSQNKHIQHTKIVRLRLVLHNPLCCCSGEQACYHLMPFSLKDAFKNRLKSPQIELMLLKHLFIQQTATAIKNSLVFVMKYTVNEFLADVTQLV